MNETLLVLLVKSAVLSTVGLMVAVLLRQFAARRVSAAARHLVCLSTFAALASLPVLSAVLPVWRLAPPVLMAAVVSPETSHPQYPYGWASQHPDDPYPRRATDWATPPTFPVAATRTEAVGSRASSPSMYRAGADIGRFAIFVYVAGMVVLLTRLSAGHLAVWRMTRRAVRVPEQAFGGVPVCESPEVSVPLTVGAGRSAVIVLPIGFAASASPEQLRAVLAHELAHVRRGDYLFQTFADALCALYFVNPLIWLLSRALRNEAERATDDRVLAESNIRPSEYAACLVETVRGLQNRRGVSRSAVTMARCADISVRVRAVLETNANRTGRISWAGMVILGLVCAGVTGGVATSRAVQGPEPDNLPVAASQERVSTVPGSAFRRTLTDGTVVEIDSVAASGFGKPNALLLWKPGGELVPRPRDGERPGMYRFNRPFPNGLPSQRFLLSLRGPRILNREVVEDIQMQVAKGDFIQSQREIGSSEQFVMAQDVHITSPSETAIVSVRIPRSDWHPLLSVTAFTTWKGRTQQVLGDVSTTVRFSSSGEIFDSKNRMTRPVQTPTGVLFTFTSQITHNSKVTDVAPRFIAETWQGRTIVGQINRMTGNGSSVTRTVLLPVASLAQIKSFRAEARAYDTVTFSGIALKPIEPQMSANSPFRQTLPDGTTVEVVSVANGTSLNTKNRVFWKPDGTPISGSRTYSLPYGQGTGSPVDPNKPEYEVAVAFQGPRSKWPKFNRIGRVIGANFHGMSSGNGGELPSHVSLITGHLNSSGIRVGVAKDEWHTLQTVEGSQGSIAGPTDSIGSTNRDTVIPSVAFALLRPRDTPEGTVVTVSHGSFGETDVDYRFIAEMENGKRVIGKSLGSGVASGEITLEEVLFPGTPRAQVKAFRMQGRTYDWVTFPGIALKSNAVR